MATGTFTASILGSVQLTEHIGVAKITSPQPGTIVARGSALTITGTASSPTFSSYTLEYGVGPSPISWTTLITSTNQVTNGTLGVLDPVPQASQLKTLTLRLMVTESDADQTIDTVPVEIFSIYDTTLSPPAISPNHDGVQETTSISARINLDSTWTLEILDTGLGVVKTVTGSGVIVSHTWDGTNEAHVLVSEGAYSCRLTATERVSGVVTIEMFGPLHVDTTVPMAVISSPTVDQTVYHTVPIVGTANDDATFLSYTVAFGLGESPAEWTQVTRSTVPVSNGELAHWATKQLVPEEPEVPAFKETGLPNGVYTVRLIVLDQAGNTYQTTRRVNVENLFITTVSVSPRLFDPTENQTSTISYTLNLDSHVTIQLFSRDIATGTPTVQATPLTQALRPAGTNADAWNGRNDTGAILPLTYYTFTITAATPTGERTAVYDRFFKYGVYPWPFHHKQWLFPIPTRLTDVPGGFNIQYTTDTFSRVEVEVGIPCTGAVIDRPEVDTPKLPGPQTVFWDARDETGQLPADACPFDRDRSIGAKGYPLPENAIALASEPLTISGLSTEPIAITPTTDEISTIAYTLNRDVDTFTLTITDPTGKPFRTLPGLPTTAGSHTVEWDGRNDHGKLATQHGDYVVELSAAVDKNGALLQVRRTSRIGVLGDYRVDAHGTRLHKRLQIIDVSDPTRRLLGIKTQEIDS